MTDETRRGAIAGLIPRTLISEHRLVDAPPPCLRPEEPRNPDCEGKGP